MGKSKWHLILISFAGFAAFLFLINPVYANDWLVNAWSNPDAPKLGKDSGRQCYYCLFPFVLLLSLPIVIAIEAVVIKWTCAISWKDAFKAAALMNVFSTAVGVIISLIGTFILHSFLQYGLSGRTMVIIPITIILLILHLRSNTTYLMASVAIGLLVFGALVFLVVYSYHIPFFIIASYSFTLALEVWPARSYIPSSQIDKSLILANTATYIPMALLFHIGY